MPDTTAPAVSRRALVAVILCLYCMLFLLSWATVHLRTAGYPPSLAENLPRLVGLPLLFAAAWLLVRSDGQSAAGLFAAHLRIPLVLSAVAIGLLSRVASWAQLTARGSFGVLPGARAAEPRPYSFGWDCPDTVVLLIAFLVWLLLVPLTEEFVHRGIIQNYFRRRGAVAAILLSTLIFMISHPPGTYATAFVMGLILGFQYWKRNVLWYPVLTHATYDGFIPLDTLCLKLSWNPAMEQLPAWRPGLVSVLVFVSAAAAIAFLLLRPGRAEPAATQPAATPERRA